LRAQNTQLQASIAEATKYARSLEAEIATLQQRGLDLEDAREESRRLADAVARMRGEIIALNRALDAAQPFHGAQVLQQVLQEEVNTLRAPGEQLAACMPA